MKCPKTFRVSDKGEKGLIFKSADCLREECAWWDIADEKCILQTIPFELNRIGSALQLIKQKEGG